jgi:DNA-3-methyladenine glycosylase II
MRGSLVQVPCREPFDLDLSLRAMRSFGRTQAQAAAEDAAAASTEAVLRLGVRLEERPTLVVIRQVQLSPPVVQAEARPGPVSAQAVADLGRHVVNADLDLNPFYEVASSHRVLGPLTRRLHGLKGFRPASLFDMLVTAVIEQQISLLVARRMHERVVERFGDEVEGERVFPAPKTLAVASVQELMACGLSGRKAEYVIGLAQAIEGGELDLEQLERAADDEVRERIVSLRGFGRWSADYVLIRGLARPDAVPVDDLGVRTVVGRLLGDGGRPTADETAALLEPLAPYRGLAAFYLLVAARLP